jgi:hypothetical protein
MFKNPMIRALSLGLFFCLLSLSMSRPAAAQIGVGVAVTIAPPEIPVYDQPVCPGDGYLWTPGYWAWDPGFADYYWVPGTWVLAPEVGFLWTPGYWAWGDGGFFFTAGFWGPTVGFYGGINYGFGYFGTGFVGGRWQGGHFFYNRAVLNINVNVIHNVYETHVDIRNTTRVSYNGGRGGLTVRPTPEEEAAGRERHLGPVPEQTRHIEEARNNPQLRSKFNHGLPPVAATARPGEFTGSGVVAARGAAAVRNEAEARPGNAGARPAVHPNELPPAERPPAPNTGNPKLDQKYQKEQEKLAQQQEKERQQLQAKQDAEHAKAAKQQANAARQQQMEQRHQQQTQQLQQRQRQETQRMVQRQSAPRASSSRPR